LCLNYEGFLLNPSGPVHLSFFTMSKNAANNRDIEKRRDNQEF
jgi:hypothetical protein